MAVFSAMLVGTVCGVAVLGTTLMTLARRSQPVKRRQRASVTEILQVDMVDRGLYYTATNIDCSLDMELHTQSNLNTSSYSDQVLKPPKGGFNEVFAWGRRALLHRRGREGHWEGWSVLFALYIVHRAMYSVYCAMFNAQCTVCILLWVICNVWCAM